MVLVEAAPLVDLEELAVVEIRVDLLELLEVMELLTLEVAEAPEVI